MLNGMQLQIQELEKPKLYVSWELKCGVEQNSVRNERELGVQQNLMMENQRSLYIDQKSNPQYFSKQNVFDKVLLRESNKF